MKGFRCLRNTIPAPSLPMKKPKPKPKPKPANGIAILPEYIIQDIQSRLTRKEAAQTTVLSKAWYSAWKTRPDMELDYRRVQGNGGPDAPDPFPEYAREEIRRYVELNLKIETFRLCMEIGKLDRSPLAGELITKAMNMSAKDMELVFLSKPAKNDFLLPREVLGYENLVRLSTTGCKVDRAADKTVSWPDLKLLSLRQASIEGDVLWDMMRKCPLIEELLLSECKFLTEYTINNVTRYLDFGHYGSGSPVIAKKPLIPYVFNHLTNLIFSYVKIDASFFFDFSSKFPRIKGIAFSHCLGPKKIHIESLSLEHIHIDQIVMLRARIDVPGLRRFTLSTAHVPNLSFGTVTGEWVARVSAGCSRSINNAWFRHFKKFLMTMLPSSLSLSLYLTPSFRDNFNRATGLLRGPALEFLAINAAALDIHPFWDGLFWSCRPKCITTACFSMRDMGALEVACRRLATFDDDNGYMGANRSMFGQSDLDEVSVQTFDETAVEWKPAAWKTLIGASATIETKKRIRFEFSWIN